MASTHPPGAGLLAGACLLVGTCLAEGALAGPDMSPHIGVEIFPITRSIWREVDLANDPPILVRVRDREVLWEVDHEAASHGPVLWNPSGSFALADAPRFCEWLGVFVEDPEASAEYRKYPRLSDSHQRVFYASSPPIPSAPREIVTSSEASRSPLDSDGLECEFFADYCTRYPDGAPQLMTSRLGSDTVVNFDCKTPDESYASCKQVEAGRASDRAQLEALLPVPPAGWQSGQVKSLSCNALVVAGREPDGSLVIRVVDANGGVWGSAPRPLWDRRARLTRAALLTPVTAVGDVGIMTFQTVVSALTIVVYAPLFLIAGLP
ncbi:MAG TPA: hypothetical protein VII72_07910 [Myxococcota bacterium]|jgi:hypothetical protein